MPPSPESLSSIFSRHFSRVPEVDAVEYATVRRELRAQAESIWGASFSRVSTHQALCSYQGYWDTHMTSRLKRKLDHLGVDPSSSKLNENFCLIGTPLPPLDKAKDKGEFVPVWKQDVRDEQGRRRLHGAFTGGFSAGYFNTVGSKEGWMPATFTSSRSDRTTKKGARPEDFMDDEDLAELRDSQKLVDITEQVDIFGGTGAEIRKGSGAVGETDSISSALESLVPAPNDSVGARLLRKSGWRPGQGIGPRITYKQLQAQQLQSSTTSSIAPPEVASGESDDDEAAKHLYAPRDTKVLIFRAKDNSHGLGYTPGMGLSEIVDGSANGSSGPTISAGFGLGALNDAEDDDVDIYASGYGPSGRQRRLAYDDDEDEGERVILGKRRGLGRDNAKPESQANHVSSTFHDGRLVLRGYVLGDKPVIEDKWFKIPDVPKGWKPNPQKVWGAAKGEDTKRTDVPTGVINKLGRIEISTDQRGALLGEAFLKPAQRSVFDYLSAKDRERIQNIKSGQETKPSDPLPSSSSSLPSAHIPATKVVVPILEPRTASGAMQGYQPFVTDPPKQARYTAYLNTQAQAIANPALQPAPGQSIDSLNKELDDFAKAARVFKPITGAMANRFTSASIVDTGPKAVEGLHMPSQSQDSAPAPVPEKIEEPLSAKAHAAKSGMFGRLTRETVDWFPNRLLCKRFGVKDPHPDGASAEVAPTTAAAEAASFGTQFTPQAPVNPTTVVEPSDTLPKSSSGRKDISNIGLGDDDDQGQDTLTYERPAMDIFKAIFASDDEESDDGGGGGVPEKETSTSETPVPALPVVSLTSKPPAVPITTPASQDEDMDVVDITTFRPTFVSKAVREGKEKGSDANKEKGGKKKKAKKSAASLMSFQGEEGGDEGPAIQIPSLAKQKKRVRENGEEDKNKKAKKKRPKDGTGEEDVWVEKVVPATQTTPSLLQGKGRMKAADFL